MCVCREGVRGARGGAQGEVWPSGGHSKPRHRKYCMAEATSRGYWPRLHLVAQVLLALGRLRGARLGQHRIRRLQLDTIPPLQRRGTRLADGTLERDAIQAALPVGGGGNGAYMTEQ